MKLIIIGIFVTVIALGTACAQASPSSETTSGVEKQSSEKDVFMAATGNMKDKMAQSNANSEETNTQSAPVSACPNKSKELNGQIFLTSPNGNAFLGITPDLKPSKKYKYSASDIYWAVLKGDSFSIKKKPSFVWVMPDDNLPDTTFWLKYSSKFDIKLILDKPFNKWEDLLDAKITPGGVKEDDFGKRDNLNIDETWCFTGIDPSSWPQWAEPQSQQNKK